MSDVALQVALYVAWGVVALGIVSFLLSLVFGWRRDSRFVSNEQLNRHRVTPRIPLSSEDAP